MAPGDLRIGIVGAGQITRSRHLPGFRKLPVVRVVGVCNRHRESAVRVARDFDIPHIYADWEELISDPEIDAVLIGAWPYLHCPVTLAALDSGKHVLTQARMAMNAREASRMLERSYECPSLTAMVVPSPYGLTGEAFVRSLIADGFLGELRELHVQSTSSDLADASKLVPDRLDPELGKVVRVGTPDSLQILTTQEDGSCGLYRFSAAVWHEKVMSVALYGSEGTLVYDLLRDEIRVLARPKTTSSCSPFPTR